jgi:hypothetical protein
LIGDSTDLPINKNDEFFYGGEGGFYSHKLGDFGN